MELTPQDENFRPLPQKGTDFRVIEEDAEYAYEVFPFLRNYGSNPHRGWITFPPECVTYIVEAQDDWIAKHDSKKWEFDGIY